MTIDSFRGEYDYLSNFYSCPVEYDGLTYQNTEAAFQAAKCVDLKRKRKICWSVSQSSKKIGKKGKPQRRLEAVKIDVMRDVLKSKFSPNPELREKLIATGDVELIEGNHWNDLILGSLSSKGQTILENY